MIKTRAQKSCRTDNETPVEDAGKSQTSKIRHQKRDQKPEEIGEKIAENGENPKKGQPESAQDGKTEE